MAADWGVLGLSGDPAPGDPAEIRSGADHFTHQADALTNSSSRLAALATGSGQLGLAGDFAHGFEQALQALPGEMARSAGAYRSCAAALSAFASHLDRAQSMARSALTRGTAAWHEYRGATQLLETLTPTSGMSTPATLGLNGLGLSSVTTGMDEGLRQEIRAASMRAHQADAERNAARRLAEQAAELRADAETRCAHAIHDAVKDIENDPWWQRAWDVVRAPFASWDSFVAVSGAAALVLGIAALFVSGPIGWGLMAMATAAGAVTATDGLIKYAKGEIGAATLALDLLGVLPGLGLASGAAGVLGRMLQQFPRAGRVFTSTTAAVHGKHLLDARDVAAIRDYTGHGYFDLNDALRTGTIPDAITAQRIQDLSDALAKLPEAKGTVFRGTHLSSEDLAALRPGEVTEFRGFTSATSDIDQAFNGNTLLYIESQTGKAISQYSRWPEEAEVLFNKGTPFDVLANQYDMASGRFEIFLKEVPK